VLNKQSKRKKEAGAMTMDARKQRVLQAIVALYGLEGEPVGSSVLANYFDMAVSSATLRNEMAALTKLGLLEQPHTSAGRVPSAKGYRYYLDNLLTGSQALLNCFAQRAFFDIGNKIFNDFKVDVGFKQSHSHFAQRSFKIVFCYFAAAAEHFYRILQSFR